MAYPKRLFWVDIETTGLPEGNNFDDVHLLEIAVIVTDFALNPEVGYTEVVRMTTDAADAIRRNDVVREMHKKSGLLRESIQGGLSMEEVENEILALLVEGEDYIISGSGVATFDLQFIKAKMPRLAERLAYFPLDIGVLRRGAKILSGGKDVINPVQASFGDTKEHRALADVEAHMEEARRFSAYFKGEA